VLHFTHATAIIFLHWIQPDQQMSLRRTNKHARHNCVALTLFDLVSGSWLGFRIRTAIVRAGFTPDQQF
jgi:hypothetical protein